MAKKKAAKEAEEVFYVGLRDPVEVRRNILESTREAVQFLQRYEKLKSIRDEKREASKLLHNDIKELKALVNRLKRVLPKSKLRIKLHKEHVLVKCSRCGAKFDTKTDLEKHQKKHKKKKKKAKAEKKAPAKKVEAPKEETKPLTELEHLESELSDIESKLGKLS